MGGGVLRFAEDKTRFGLGKSQLALKWKKIRCVLACTRVGSFRSALYSFVFLQSRFESGRLQMKLYCKLNVQGCKEEFVSHPKPITRQNHVELAKKKFFL
jgi:hypothetical protein